MSEYCLNPVNIPEPPRHTQIKPRCLICKKFPVCRIREDYLKTAYLIQEVLGDPQEDRELVPCDRGFVGYDIENPTDYLPETLSIVNLKEGEEPYNGTLKALKYKDKDRLQALYDVEGYLVVFKITWDEAFERYTLSDGTELYYSIIFKPVSYEIDDTALQVWRLEMIEKEEEEKEKEKDIIDTTHFSAILNCDFFEADKHLTEEQGWKRMELHWKDHPPYRPCHPKLYHLATYHIEPRHVPELDHSFAPTPILYPVFLPKPPCPPPKRPPMRRDDMND